MKKARTLARLRINGRDDIKVFEMIRKLEALFHSFINLSTLKTRRMVVALPISTAVNYEAKINTSESITMIISNLFQFSEK